MDLPIALALARGFRYEAVRSRDRRWFDRVAGRLRDRAEVRS